MPFADNKKPGIKTGFLDGGSDEAAQIPDFR